MLLSIPTRLRSTLPALLALGLAALPATAQSPDRFGAVTEIVRGARATGLGATQVGAPDPDLFLRHPALAGASSGMHLGVQRFGTAGTGLSLATGRSWFGGRIQVGLGLETLEYRSVGAGARGGGLDPLFGSGEVGASETAAALGLSTELFGFDVGVTTRALSSRWNSTRRTSALFDLGVARRAGPIQVALTAAGLGSAITVDGREIDPPTELRLGFGAYGRPLGPLDLGLAGEFGRRADGELLAGGGLELGYWPIQGRTFVARIGMRRVPEGEASPLSLGASYWGDDLVLTWGWRPVEGTDGLHSITIGWR